MKKSWLNVNESNPDSKSINNFEGLINADANQRFTVLKTIIFPLLQKHVFLLFIALITCGSVHAQRDPLLWPFSKTSIWNMPIHNSANYVHATIGAAGAYGMTKDEDHIVFYNSANPLTNVYEMSGTWGGREPHSNGNVLFSARIPSGYTYYHGTDNNCFTLFVDNENFIQTQPMQYISSQNKWTSKYVWASQNIYDDQGIEGNHGGSKMSGFGGTVRLGELNPGSVIKHALKVNIYCALYAYHSTNEPDGKPGYRWPALAADSGAGDPGSGNYYGGSNPEVQMGTLLALRPDFNISSLRTEPARILAKAMQDYGAYIVDNTAWDVYAIETEEGPQGSVVNEVLNNYGISFVTPATRNNQNGANTQTWDWARDMADIFTSLHAISNNTSTTIGGGPTSDWTNRRAPMAPDFGTTVSVTGVTVSPTSASVAVGDTTSLTATVAPSNATNKTVSWSSSNTSVATVNASGVVSSVAAGTATITVTTQDGGFTATSAITVTSSSGVSTPPTYVAAGSVAAGRGTITPGLPSGIATGDILLLFLETANQTISVSNQNGGTWAQVTNSPQGTGTAGGTSATRLTVFWSRYNGTQGAPTASDAGNHQIGRIIAIRGAVTSGDPFDVTAGGVESTADVSGSIPGATTTVSNALIVAAIATALPDANGTSNFSSWANSNLTSVTERTDNTSRAGNGGGLAIATGIKATAGAYGNTAVTCGSSSAKGMMSIAIKPHNSSVTIPNAPSGVSATTVSSSQIDLAWTDNSSNEDGFRIERKTGSGGTYSQIATVGAGVTSYSNTGLTASTTYYYRVIAYNSAGNSSYSNEASATTQSTGSSITYIEDFNDNIAQDWAVLSGTWTATGNQYYNSTTGAIERAIYNGSTFADFTYKVKAMSVWNNWYGIIFNYQDANNYYYVGLKASFNIELRRVLNGSTSTLYTSTYSGGGENVWSNIEISNNGTNTTVKVNGSTIFNNVSTPQWAYGKIGLWSDWNPVYFDDVEVTALSTLKSAMVTTDIIQTTSSQLNIYPNPASTSEITIELDGYKERKTVRIISLLGQVVLEQELEEGSTHSIDIGKISKGLYLVHLLVDDKAFSKKILIE